MDIVEKLVRFRIKDNILILLNNGRLTSTDYNIVVAAKKELRVNNGVIFINVMAQEKGIRKIMVKTKIMTLVYEYRSLTKELIIKGERVNVVS